MAVLSNLPQTETGHIRKNDAMRWLSSLDEPSAKELAESVVPKPPEFTGSKYATEVSSVRITGEAEFVEAAARFFSTFEKFENDETRVEVNLQQTEDRESEELTDNYALYLSIAERK
ncbi:hypothetical protein K0C01_08540 [Salinarchaeum sp. IM2453]|uniref:hypothetical protein n=1 Tax=Salinarchaeum sp. IM2453 TaxID=2862870 RepID=UPI001C839432|nr:hypothetical protein [Salinarchaeum sp. IM2453]QZA87844.1 hypothetical protein K0C01_08540 [Salinarchaeum sp. IM2453]